MGYIGAMMAQPLSHGLARRPVPNARLNLRIVSALRIGGAQRVRAQWLKSQ